MLVSKEFEVVQNHTTLKYLNILFWVKNVYSAHLALKLWIETLPSRGCHVGHKRCHGLIHFDWISLKRQYWWSVSLLCLHFNMYNEEVYNFSTEGKKKSMGWGEAGNLSRLSSSACFDLWWARHRLTRFFYIQSRTFDSSWLFFEIFLFCLSLHISFFLPPSAAGICPLKAQGGREQGLRAGRQQELEDAKIWLLLLVGCGLMDGRGRSEHSSVCSAGSPSTETIFTGKSKNNNTKQKEREILFFLGKRKCLVLVEASFGGGNPEGAWRKRSLARLGAALVRRGCKNPSPI